MSGRERLREVGVSTVRKDGLAKVTGAAQYLDDVVVPNVTFAALVRSPYAHARIVGVDATAARAVPGVLAAVTTEDLGELGTRCFGSYTKDQPVLARGVVRFEGEPIAAVVASDARTARTAAALVDVLYEERACVVDPTRASAPGAPLVHETPPPLGRQGRWPAVPGTNICARVAWYCAARLWNVIAAARSAFSRHLRTSPRRYVASAAVLVSGSGLLRGRRRLSGRTRPNGAPESQ